MRQHFNLQRYENNPRPPNISAKKLFRHTHRKKLPKPLPISKKLLTFAQPTCYGQ